MTSTNIARLVEKIANYLKRENILVKYSEIREKKSKYEIILKLDKNIADLSTIKIIYSRGKRGSIRVYTGRTSFDLRLKRFINRELSRMEDQNETTTQE